MLRFLLMIGKCEVHTHVHAVTGCHHQEMILRKIKVQC